MLQIEWLGSSVADPSLEIKLQMLFFRCLSSFYVNLFFSWEINITSLSIV